MELQVFKYMFFIAEYFAYIIVGFFISNVIF